MFSVQYDVEKPSKPKKNNHEELPSNPINKK